MLLAAIVISVLIGPIIWDRSPTAHQIEATLQGPSLAHPLGTDQFGRDLLARILTGARWTLLGAAVVSLAISSIGLVVGAVAASSRRSIDLVISRCIEAVIALPGLVMALAITSILGPSFRNLLIAMILSGWPWYARAYRAVVLRERACAYVEGAVVTGASPLRIMLRHIAPNIVGPVVVLATVNLGSVILGLAALSFLGLGIQPPTPEWGTMISESRLYFQRHPWQMIVPGLCITITVLSVNIAGDALRDTLDPRLRGR
jgi:ABC-type dipeptide/oligopeptide/nickel transport system permease subunit